jgi:hypothetical protein
MGNEALSASREVPMERLSLPLDPNRSYRVQEIAFLWNLDDETVRRLFIREPGVMILSNPRRGARIVKRTLIVPGHVAIRVQTRMTVVAAR